MKVIIPIALFISCIISPANAGSGGDNAVVGGAVVAPDKFQCYMNIWEHFEKRNCKTEYFNIHQAADAPAIEIPEFDACSTTVEKDGTVIKDCITKSECKALNMDGKCKTEKGVKSCCCYGNGCNAATGCNATLALAAAMLIIAMIIH